MNFLQKLFLARYSLFAGIILFLLPIVVLQIGMFSPLLAGLFDLDGLWEMFWATFFAYLLALSVFVTFRIMSAYGPTRCGLSVPENNNQFRSQLFSKLIFAVVLMLPLPMILNAYRLVGSWRQAGGAILGFVAALLVAFIVDFGQRLFNTFQGERPNSAKHLLLPFSYPFSSWAEKSSVASFVFSAPAFSRIQRFIQNLNPKYGAGIINRDCVPPSIQPGIVLAVALFLAFLTIYVVGLFFWIRPTGNGSLLNDLGITTMSYFLVLITLLCWLLSGIAFYADRFRVPSVILILLILIFSEGDHTFIVRQNINPASIPPTPHSIMQTRANDPYIILVAANGGGIQSAAWTAEVLTTIDEECRKVDPGKQGCGNAIALISGVSGGSVGTMYYVDGLGETCDRVAMNDVVRRSASRSSLAYVGGGLVFNDSIRNVPILNWLFDNGMDRGKYLERGWIRNREKAVHDYMASNKPPCDGSQDFVVPNRLSQTISEWGNSIANERRPTVIFNATMVESGKRLLFSDARFETKRDNTADWITFNQLFGESSDIDVVEAVRLSASFPFVTPAAARPGGNDPLQNEHVVDGGYFDNYGLMSVRDFVADSLISNPFNEGHHPKVIVIQIYGDEVVRDVNGDIDPEKASQLNQNRFGLFSWYQQTLAPLNTMLNVRQTSQYTRNKEAFQKIEELLMGKADVSYFVFKFSKKKKSVAEKTDQAGVTVKSEAAVQPEDYEPPPLSWHLTEKEQKAIKQVSCEMRSGLDLNENTTNWKGLMDLLRTPNSTSDWTRCPIQKQ
jgi:hypothetical protein